MRNPDYKIVINDISSKITNPREELMKEKESNLLKPFIFKGYKSEADRIKDAVYNNRLLYNLPDYPDEQSERISKEKSAKNKKDIIYNFNINIPQKYNTINNNGDIDAHGLINKDKEKEVDNNMPLNEKNESRINSRKNTRTSSFLNFRNSSSLRKLSETEKNKYNELIRKNLIYQPQMRFTARTDLERVFDLLNYRSFKEDIHIIEKQLTKIDLYTFKKPKELINLQNKKTKKEDENKISEKKYNVLPNPIIEEEKKHNERLQKEKLLYGKKNLYYEPNNNNKKLWARKENLNKEAKKLLSSYHYKTHFKATEEAQFKIKKKSQSLTTDNAELNSCLMIPNIFNTESNELIKHKKEKNGKILLNRNNNSYLNYLEMDKKKDIFNFGQDLYKDNEDNNEIQNYEDLTKQYQNNPIFDNNNRRKIKPNPIFMKNLSEIAFKKKDKYQNSENDEKSEDFEEKSTSIMNERYNMDNKKNNLIDDDNIHNTAKLILGECNIYSSKSKFNNAFHKSGTGKTMITKGLSVNDFLKKHSLNE